MMSLTTASKDPIILLAGAALLLTIAAALA